MAGESPSEHTSLTRDLLPALGFALGLALLVAAAYDTGYGAPPPSEKRYSRARDALESLKSDARRNVYRDQWLRLADEFYDIYVGDPQWINRPAALFRSAETLEGLSERSFAAGDYAGAAERYELVAKKHAASQLADDALLRAAILRAKHMNDKAGSLRLLGWIRSRYARGDMAAEAARLEKELSAASKPPVLNSSIREKASPREGPAELTRISWITLNPDKVQITVELDRHAPWQVRLREAEKGKPARVTLEMRGTAPAEQVRTGARVKGSLLTRVLVAQNAERATVLSFDFTSARRYDARVEQNPFRIVLTVLAGKARPSRGVGGRAGFAEAARPTPAGRRIDAPLRIAAGDVAAGGLGEPHPARAAKASAAGDMAAQLGLTVQKVFIDAGHGGGDPGAVHNGVVERDAVLDIARRVGKLLAANGLEVEYSRTGNVFMPLSARPRQANVVRADLFVSIHVNAGRDPGIQGFETYYLDLARSDRAARVATLENAASDRKLGDMQSVLAEVVLSARTQESGRLAGDVQRAALSRLKRRGYKPHDGGTRSAPFHVLIGAGMPAILVEVGYSTAVKEAALLSTSAYRHAIAEGIAEGVLAYKNRLQHRHSAQIILTEKTEGAI